MLKDGGEGHERRKKTKGDKSGGGDKGKGEHFKMSQRYLRACVLSLNKTQNETLRHM